MVDVQKDVFWKAGLLTLGVFVLGILLGLFIEDSRLSEVKEEYKIFELDLADARLQSAYYAILEPELCQVAIDENLYFADKIYREGLKLGDYDKANRLTEGILFDKKRYALLKTEFWLNSINLKEKCKADYVNVVYFYKDKPSLEERAKQNVQSIILRDLKEKYGARVMLIPLPIDLDISTVNIFKGAFNITKVPSLLINERIKLEGIRNQEEIEKLLGLKDGV